MANRTRLIERRALLREDIMRIGPIILIALVVAAGGTLALMNNACKTAAIRSAPQKCR